MFILNKLQVGDVGQCMYRDRGRREQTKGEERSMFSASLLVEAA